MKYKISFKMRIIIFTGIVVVINSILLTLMSMYNAKQQLTVAVTSSVVDTFKENEASIQIYPPQSYENSISFTVPVEEGNAESMIVNNVSRQFNILGILYTVFITIFGMIAAYFFAGKSLKPIRELNDAVLNITESNLSERVPVSETKDEISSLTSSFNSMLDRLDESFIRQKRFSSNAAHELKTPVSVIKTGIQMLELDNNADIEEYKETISIIKRNVSRLCDVIDDLMALTNENYELSEEVISLNAMVKSCVKDAEAAYGSRNITVEYDFFDKESFILCNQTLAYRVFYNLIENAFKYNTENGKVCVGLYDEDDRINICISNTGSHLNDEEILNIWEPFYCVDPSRSRKLGGAGLGLSIVKEIAERFGWGVSVKSEAGKMTVFTVSIKKQ